MKNIRKFFKVLSLYILCLYMIYTGNNIKLNKPSSFKEVWKYCERWENGEL